MSSACVGYTFISIHDLSDSSPQPPGIKRGRCVLISILHIHIRGLKSRDFRSALPIQSNREKLSPFSKEAHSGEPAFSCWNMGGGYEETRTLGLSTWRCYSNKKSGQFITIVKDTNLSMYWHQWTVFTHPGAINTQPVLSQISLVTPWHSPFYMKEVLQLLVVIPSHVECYSVLIPRWNSGSSQAFIFTCP